MSRGALMSRVLRWLGVVVAVAASVAVLSAPSAAADTGWVAVANSPNREQQDWAYGPDQAGAEFTALTRCAALERATDCRILAVSTDCVATAWDAAEPLNRIYAASAADPDTAVRAALAAAGPYANDITVRCTWWPRDEPGAPAPGTTLTRRVSAG